MNQFTYPSKRPNLTIEYTGGRQISNCYESSSYKVTSKWRLKKESILKLREAGFLGIGQEFYISSQCDGKEEPAFFDSLECVEIDSKGNVVPGIPINQYTGEPRKSFTQPYYEYLCESRCDSGD